MMLIRSRWLALLISLLFIVAVVAGCAETPSQPESPADEQNHDSDHHKDADHHHGEDLVEWSAVYDLEAGEYELVFQESDSDPSIMVVFLDESLYREEGDDLVAQHKAQHLMEDNPELVAPGARIEVTDEAAYNLTLEPEGTTYVLHVPQAGSFIILTEHFAWEFDMQIIDEAGTAIPSYNVKEYTEPHAH